MKKRIIVFISSIIISIVGSCLYNNYNTKDNNMFSMYLDGIFVKSLPDTDFYNLVDTDCEKGSTVRWDSAFGKVSSTIIDNEEACNLYFKVKNFENQNIGYTGSPVLVSLPKGTYKLEVWGAQGGASGGKGGYSVGTYSVSKATNVYVVVGGQGATSSDNTVGGGYNGGGSSSYTGLNGMITFNNGAGGGATHIATKDGLLSSLSSSKSSVLIVAGGGGGTMSGYSTEGYGGGTNGGSGKILINGGPSDYNYTLPTGGAQNDFGKKGYVKLNSSELYGTDGSFGQGGNGTAGGTGGSGGGGGWYGGAGGIALWAVDLGESGLADGVGVSAGGGSGYVNTTYLTGASTKGGNTSFASPSGGTEIGHSGNGYAKITKIS